MDDLVRLQQHEIDTLRERVRQLESLLMDDRVSIPPEWGLVNAERRCFAALVRRDIVTKEQLYAALYGDRVDFGEISENAVESHISKMRKKLRRFGVTVSSQRFVGYSLHNRASFLGKAVNG